MQALEVMQSVFGRGKVSSIETSSRMGMSRSYIGGVLSRGSTPKADTYAMIMDAAGYDLVLRSRATGEEITIDPPPRD